ncbi:hypothetical protein [Nitrososphaera viennensis]|uniref:Uncharacterized protein n=2 Tax=Nitrososphaera viennensis TaxID=1034015 RepID=A0A060HJH4_9ARCH|nr:hypothetical protein [Nitrososphaera viennensis]AIC16714.1 hypothetical protein NVIE_024500 [Nitrososphaera viennensis EN76]UVS68633.1 hypothetical protein NWT39_12090 [Nitrososphaera viennensis]
MNSEEESDELRSLLEVVSDKGLRVLSIQELDRLRMLLVAKDYGENKKADRSRKKLLKKINAEMFDRHSPRRLF